MELNEYQERAGATAIYPGRRDDWRRQTPLFVDGLIYSALKLNGEAGEVAERVGKAMRDDDGVLTETCIKAIKKECGDVLWYIAAICHELQTSLEEVAEMNLRKLESRAKRGVLGGSGDDR